MPSWRERLERAKQIAQERAPEARARAEEMAERARTAAREQSKQGRARLDTKLEERRRERERRERWFEQASAPTHTQGFPDEESMRHSIEAAAEHGWTVVSIADVPQRKALGGLTTLVARMAVERVKQSSQFMVTFNRVMDGEEPSDKSNIDPPSEGP